MAVLRIYEFPHSVLRQQARKVKKIDESITRLVQDMIDTLHATNGVGLAANQVGILKRIIVIRTPEDTEPRVYINPEITYQEGEREVDEGCLSMPGYTAVVTRSMNVKAQALDGTMQEIKIKADGLLAQALEHEIDHLNGILYIDHIKAHQQLVKVEPEPESGPESDTPSVQAATG